MTAEQIDAAHEQIITMCGASHGYPDPAWLPKSRWPQVVPLVYRFFRDSPRKDLKAMQPPPEDVAIAYYVRQAPEKLELPAPNPNLDDGGIEFKQASIGSISHL